MESDVLSTVPPLPPRYRFRDLVWGEYGDHDRFKNYAVILFFLTIIKLSIFRSGKEKLTVSIFVFGCFFVCLLCLHCLTLR